MSIVAEATGATRPSLSANVRWVLFGNVAHAAGQWLQLLILARLGGPAAVGKYAFALALTAPVMNLAALQLRMLQASDIPGTYAFREYRRLRVSTTLLAMVAIGLLGWLSGTGREDWPVLVAVCAMRAADALTEVYYGAWQRHERMAVAGGGLAFGAGCAAVFMIALAAAGGGVAGAASGAALGSCAALVFVHVLTRRDRDLRAHVCATDTVEWRRVGRLAFEALPLGVIVLLSSLQANVPQYFVRLRFGEAELGVFAAASQLTAAGTMVVGALGASASPRLASQYVAGDLRGFWSLTRRLVLAGATLGVGGLALSVVLGRHILALLYRPEFGSGEGVLIVLSGAAGMAFVAALLGYALTSARIIAVQPVVIAITLCVLVVACTILVPRGGGVGAAWALAIATTAHATGNAAVLWRRCSRPSLARAAMSSPGAAAPSTEAPPAS